METITPGTKTYPRSCSAFDDGRTQQLANLRVTYYLDGRCQGPETGDSTIMMSEE